MTVVIDQPVNDFQAQATSGQVVSLAALRGQQVLIYFLIVSRSLPAL